MTTTTVPRISSTQLNDFDRCPRLWAFVHAAGEDSGVGYAAAVGTIVHACLEHRLLTGRLPTYAEVMAMDGNYDAPAVSLGRFAHKGIWDEALTTAEGVGCPWQHVPDDYEDIEVERNLELWDIRIGDTRCGGYIDVFAVDPTRNTALLFDWKTRGKSSWKYRPSKEELATNRQLLYYASVVRQALGVDAIDVVHGNILRAGEGGPAVEVVRSRILGVEADAFFAELTEKTLPRMHAVHTLWASPKQRGDVPADRTACFKYGPCAQMTRCNALDGAKRGSSLDQMQRAREQDAL
jgi:hypothetical protein